MRINKKKIISFLVHSSLFLLILFFSLNIISKGIVFENWSVYISISAVLLLIIQLITMKKLKVGIRDFIFWYIILQYLFYYGRIIVHALNLDNEVPWKLFLMYSESNIFKAALFTLCYSQGFFIGFLLVNHLKIQSEKKYNRKNKIYTENVLYNTGWLMFFVTIPFELYSNIMTILAQQNGSYVAVVEISGMIGALGKVCIVSILIIIASKKLSLKRAIIFSSLFISYEIIYMVLSGDRRQAVTSFIVIGLCFLSTYNLKIKLKMIIIGSTAGYLLLSLLAAIKNVRLLGINFDSVVLALKDSFTEGNLMVEVLGEFGSTFFTIVNSISYYPNMYEYIHGKSYIASILIIIPGLFTSAFPELFNAVTIPENMQAIDGNPIGGSLGQDLFANFGYWGIAGSIVIGLVISLISRRYKNSTLVDNCRYYIIFFILINLVRCGVYEVTRSLFYAIALFEIGCLIFKKNNYIVFEKKVGID